MRRLVNDSAANKLDRYFSEVETVILSRQDPITGLLPASTAITAHGDYTDAWVRDNVYSILAAWGLGLAYRKTGKRTDRSYLLEQSTVKLMRGLLEAMMRQSAKVESFKQHQNPNQALHAKYDTRTGLPVVGDDEWGHLQLDATALFLLMLAQMTQSGLRLIFTLDEVNFVQNLVHYIARAYRTPDYGIWERGNKINTGIAELNASSIGMAKAALEAMTNLNVFGEAGDQASIIHVIPDSVARARTTLKALLPRESRSKETDAALLSIIGYPAFAIEDEALVSDTLERILTRLEGNYGCKRFLLDGHQTVLEDEARLHYTPEELQNFADIESEWPLFFCYLYLHHLFRNDFEQASAYRHKLEHISIERDGTPLLPELYFVPASHISAEKLSPHSQIRQPNENLPLVWAQSLFVLGNLLSDGLLEVDDIDPLGRHQRVGRELGKPAMLLLLAENQRTQAELAAEGVQLSTLGAIAPIKVRNTEELAAAYTTVGRNDKLGLSGRPLRQLGSLTTSRVFELGGEHYLILPQFQNRKTFYFYLDMHYQFALLNAELAYIHRHWDEPGTPLMTLMVTESALKNSNHAETVAILRALQSSKYDGISIATGEPQQLLPHAGHERIDYLHNMRFSDRCFEPRSIPNFILQATTGTPPEDQDEIAAERSDAAFIQQLQTSRNLYEQIDAVSTLLQRHNLHYAIDVGNEQKSLEDIIESIFSRAAELREWHLLRQAADLLKLQHTGLEVTLIEILSRQKQLAVGRSWHEQSLIDQPLPNGELFARIQTLCSDDYRERILTQEILLHLGMLIKSSPEIFTDLLTIRVSYLLMLLDAHVAHEHQLAPDQALDYLMQRPPSALAALLREVLSQYQIESTNLLKLEALHLASKTSAPLHAVNVAQLGLDEGTDAKDWLQWRKVNGVITRLPERFFSGTWNLLKHCNGLVIGNKYDRQSRLDSARQLSETTAAERTFALRIEKRLSRIHAPEYRQLNIEALNALIALCESNPSIQIENHLVLDVVIGHAVRLSWPVDHADKYNEQRALAWQHFYQLPPADVANAVIQATRWLLETGEAQEAAEKTA